MTLKTTRAAGLLALLILLSVSTSGAQTLSQRSSAPSPATRAAQAYNDFLVQEQLKVGRQMLRLASALNDNIDSAQVYLNLVRQQVTSSIRAVDSRVPYAQGEDFKRKALALFRLYDEVLTRDFPELISIALRAHSHTGNPLADTRRASLLVSQISEKEERLDADFQAAQQSFAAKYGIGLTSNELQDDIDRLGH